MKEIQDSLRINVEVNNVIFSFNEKQLKVLLIKRTDEPFNGQWELPNGFLDKGKTLEETAIDILNKRTGIESAFINQLGFFSNPNRDPRERIIANSFIALIEFMDVGVNKDGEPLSWFAYNELPPMAFDHESIIELALVEMKFKLRFQPIGFELLPENFTLTQLQRLYESVLDKPLDKRNFRKKILSLDLLKQSKDLDSVVEKRAATLYRFDKTKYVSLKEKGKKFTLY